MTQRRFWERVRVNGHTLGIAAEISQQETLESTEPATATIRFSGHPDVDEGDTVDIFHANLATDVGKFQLGGSVDYYRGESDPIGAYAFVNDVTALWRRVRTSDHTFDSGETDGEAVMFALDFAGIPYDPADIADAGYSLSLHEPIVWQKNVTVQEFIDEIDRVFWMRTMAIGGDGTPYAHRVIRFHYDIQPDDKVAVATYTRGSTVTFFGNKREKGKRDRIRNVIDVKGMGYDCGSDDECTCTPWAHAEATHALITGKNKSLEFQSDVIKTSDLAAEIAKLYAHRFNRREDTVEIQAENDPNIVPGKVVAVTDDNPVIGITTVKNYYVLNVDRVGNRMTLQCEGGAPGSHGTLTSGVEIVCRDSVADLGAEDVSPTPFVMPAAALPPSVPEIAVSDCDGLSDLADCTEVAFAAAIGIESSFSWEIAGTLTLTAASQGLKIGVTTTLGDYTLQLGGSSWWGSHTTHPPQIYEIATPDDTARSAGTLPLNTAIAWQLRWDTDTDTLMLFMAYDTLCWADSIADASATMLSAETIVVVNGAPTRAAETVKHGCGGLGPVVPEWTIVSTPPGWTDPWTTSWIITDGPTSGEAEVTTDADDEQADIKQQVPDNGAGLPVRTRLWGTAAVSSSGISGLIAVLIGMYSDEYTYAQEGGQNYAELFMETLADGCSPGSGWDYVAWQTSEAGSITGAIPAGWVDLCVGNFPTGITFFIDWNAPAGTVDATLNGNHVGFAWNPALDTYWVHIQAGTFDPSCTAAWDFTDLQIQFGG